MGAVTAGAGFAYLTDARLGKRRRALVRDAAVHSAKVFRKAVDLAARDTAHRLKGFFEETKGMWIHDHISDDVLADRVRTVVGRVSSHPNVEVIVDDGSVTLLGPVVAQEEALIIQSAQSVR